MRYAVDVAPLGDFADPVAIAELGRAAEAAGWDGLSIWDHLGVGMGTVSADPFIALSAVASVTERLRLIVSVAALPRRRPQLVVQAAGTLDRWSGGRLVLGIGAGGDPADFASFGEEVDRSKRVSLMDEAAGIVDSLLRGEEVEHRGPAFTVTGVTVGPRPVQEPRPPIWLGGVRPGALRRAARWDGWIAMGLTSDDPSAMTLTPGDLAGSVAAIGAERETVGLAEAPFDVAIFGMADIAPARPAAYEDAGATWWLESFSPLRGSIDHVRVVIDAGPPR